MAVVVSVGTHYSTTPMMSNNTNHESQQRMGGGGVIFTHREHEANKSRKPNDVQPPC